MSELFEKGDKAIRLALSITPEEDERILGLARRVAEDRFNQLNSAQQAPNSPAAKRLFGV